jgi:ubiquinone/menaquinone biosynthesis C-methylase UbiE
MRAHEISDLLRVWDGLAKADPLWAILSEPDKKGNRWDVQDFFQEGKREIDKLIGILRSFGAPISFGAALDFGCGVGRLTQFLADHYDAVTGVDISPTMLQLARRFNRHDSRVQYIHNAVAHLGVFPDAQFDLVYCNLVLQHMEPRIAGGYIHEFFRIAKPQGFIVFQIPSHYSEAYLPKDARDAPMPARNCRARLALRSIPDTLAAGSSGAVEVEVANLSGQDWLQSMSFPLNIGNHWRSEDGKVLIHDDARTRLPGKLAAGGQCVMRLAIKAPPQPGTYVVEIDLVQEGARWFHDAGSTTISASLRVTPAPPAAGPPQPSAALAPEPQPEGFTMSGIPRGEIEQLVADFGAELLLTQEHVAEWYSYQYYVRR